MHFLSNVPEDQESEASPDLGGEFNLATFGSGIPNSTNSRLPHEFPGLAFDDPHVAKAAAILAAPDTQPYVWSM